MYKFTVTYRSKKKYDLDIERTTVILAENLIACRMCFDRNFKHCEPIKITMEDPETKTETVLLDTVEE